MKRVFSTALAVVFSLLVVCLPQLAGAVTLEEEIKLGKQFNEQLLKNNKLDANLQTQKEIADIGAKLVKNANRPQLTYTFQVLDETELNAFAVPGGYVYFTSHLWNVLNHEERSGVLAHEIIHVDRRHSVDAMLKHQTRRTVTGILLILIGANETISKGADLVNTLHELKYSRGDEKQADEEGAKLLQKAGMNPVGLLLSMRKIKRFESEGGGRQPAIFLDHPPTKERLEYLQKLVTSMGVTIPPEDVKDIPDPHEVGSVTAVLKGGVVEFTSSKPLSVGDTVYLTSSGWDGKYENRIMKPFACGAITVASDKFRAAVKPTSPKQKLRLEVGNKVSAPTKGEMEGSMGRIGPKPSPRLTTDVPLKLGDRLIAWQHGWSKAAGAYGYVPSGYIVVTDASGGFVGIQNPDFITAPYTDNSALTRLSADPDASRWRGVVTDVNVFDKIVEVKGGDKLDTNATFDLCVPNFDARGTYQSRIAAKATIYSQGRKKLLSLTALTSGWSVDQLQVGFDVYKSESK